MKKEKKSFVLILTFIGFCTSRKILKLYTDKLIISVCLSIIIAGFSGCKKEKEEAKEPQFEIYENHEISACSVNDPLCNLEWLTEFTEKNRELGSSNWNIKIELYANLDAHEEYIVISYIPSPGYRYGDEDSANDPHLNTRVYTCSGERLFINEDIGLFNDQEWDAFFGSEKNQLQETIWYRYRIN